ncbi:MotA/TolQ/ExbB proton channel family protein [Bythopirellula polymerisocia]|uniref:MotA/TolQ/ExbB proton channel family protein n=1 Tax=Bythopirellula polymerisocia TaxID=2528003 RepID=A0A5C6CGN4_9BACT|nr:MotA/TolQ/ExbB proton channel family protein [Bythopirellula polymerisocia]TWU21899.1 MotA/TolQ/ExbB proton channel family protein [Bythopirellula polymerisocia]
MSRVSSISEWLLRQSFIWGGLACLTFYALVVGGSEPGSTIQRYFAGHWINYTTTTIFFVGLAALTIKMLGLMVQFATLDNIKLPPAGVQGQTVGDAPELLAGLAKLSSALQNCYLAERLRNALEYVQQKGSADTLESHLHHLEDADATRSHQSYSMVRIIFSTIPILGFLGTVIGITMAIAKLDLSADAMDESLPAVVAGLSVAFDTTALSLVLSTVLLFVKFCVEKVENRLLSSVDTSAAKQLVGRFQQLGTENDPHLASIRRMSEQLLSVVQTSAEKQSELLQASLDQTGSRWSEMFDGTASTLNRVMAGAAASLEESFAAAATTLDEALSGAVVEGLSRHAKALNQGVEQHAKNMEETLVRHAVLLNEGLDHHATALAQAESVVAVENRRHLAEVEAAVGEAMLVASSRQEKLISKSEQILHEMQTALVDSASATVAQQEQLYRQGEVLLRLVEGTNQIKQLEDSLNGNLRALAETHNFEQTISGLSAILQLLGAHLGKTLVNGDHLEMTPLRTQNKAA